MGTILTVHGTFAHIDIPGESDDSASSTSYWWRPDSPFNAELKSLVQAADGSVDVQPFVWSGENSERERRRAGRALYDHLMQLEDSGEPYCVVAHSHGGSVVSAALLQAAARKRQLPGLKRWITVGTPFVELRRERFLFMRLPIILKAMYVASFMLLLIFVGATIGRVWEGSINVENTNALWRLGVGGIFAALPVIVFLLIAIVRERSQRFFYRPRIKRRAKQFFGDRWLALTHEDDEAVRGLGSLRAVRLPIFDRQFAVPLLSLMSVFMLPAVYLIAINTPSLMNGLADMLRTHVYQLDELATQSASYQQSRRTMRSIRGNLRAAQKRAEDDLQPLAEREAAKRTVRQQRRVLRDQRKQLQESFPELPKLQRAHRFKRKFLQKDNRPCNNGRLCDNGENRALNAQLLLHLITDEVASLFVDDEVRRSSVGRIASYLLPVILVPVVLGGIAILWVLVVQVFAKWFSRIASRWLDGMTWAQIRRSAVGNDTEDEIAIGTAPYPRWMGEGQPYLPLAISAEITQSSNDATFQSLGKFRNALSELAFFEGRHKESDNVLAYLNWNELIHTSYFVVPSFTRLVALAIARSSGFEATPKLAETAHADVWLDEVENGRQAAA
ncbi:MAG: hypothetical protein ACR2PI_09790 [Hyphomicrobiaceae bacterium]